jgi:hypothetical protein
MLTTPDRLEAAIAALERGEQVDWRKLADLQALDTARLGRVFLAQAVALNEEFDLAAVKLISEQQR